MKTFERICIKDWETTTNNNDHFKVERGKKYTTSSEHEDGTCTVFRSSWVRVPVKNFAGEIQITNLFHCPFPLRQN